MKTFLLLTTVLTVLNDTLSEIEQPKLVDKHANAETQNLYQNLKSLAGNKTLFGHQNTNIYGVKWRNKENFSDVFDITESFPAVYGYDFWHIEAETSGVQPVDHSFDDYVRWTKWAIAKGSLVTFSWHQFNPVTKKSFYDLTPAMSSILPGGSNHEMYKAQLDLLAEFFHQIAPHPIIFRPYHEHNGDWFWWGKGVCKEEDYIQIWRFMVDYLKDEKKVHNLLYAFSPDRSRIDPEKGFEDYFYGYPGDDYVDIFGFDNYWDVGHPQNEDPVEINQERFINSLEALVDLANQHGKIAALTETGIEGQRDPKWWTQRLLAGLNHSPKTKQILWALVWRNANEQHDKKNHFYAPHKGHPAADDFIKFRKNERILFEGDYTGIYSKDSLLLEK